MLPRPRLGASAMGICQLRTTGENLAAARQGAQLGCLLRQFALLVACVLSAAPLVASTGPSAPTPVQHRELRAERSRGSEAATPVDVAVTPAADEGDRVVRAAAERLARHASVSCNLRYRVDLYGRQLAGAGSYFQSGVGDEMLLRLTLKAQLDKQVSSLLQVCDGRFLWLRRDMPERTTLGRIDLKRLRGALAASPAPPSFDLAPITALGGLPRLLNSLSAQFHFSTPQQGRFRDTPVWLVSGQWRPERLAENAPTHKDAILAGKTPWKKLPEHLPSGITLVLGRDDLFPYRLEYQRAGQGGENSDGLRSLLTLELFEVRLDAPIERSQFIYHPDNQDVVDLTEATLKKMAKVESPKQGQPTPE